MGSCLGMLVHFQPPKVMGYATLAAVVADACEGKLRGGIMGRKAGISRVLSLS